MLVFWNTLLEMGIQKQLVRVDPQAVFWPAAYMQGGYNHVVPIEWWISFHSSSSGLLWVMEYSQWCRVVQK